ncbi:hypothetical protein L1049_006071 [Liquidambar formosana]|uniref:Uncharacterized protein n=1 Tax=Liquidambar formosana TaxID=63359 RepID=A0AAP0REX4_LIQFO
MDVSIPQSNIGKGHNRFPLGFYYRVANQLVNQAKAYRDGGKIHQLYKTLDKYCRLSEVIPHHQNYTTHSTKEKLHHKKICQEFVEERETLKSLVGHDLLSQKIYALSNITERKVKNCGMAETRCESLMITNEEKAVLPSVYLMGSDSNCSLLESLCPTSMAISKGPHITAHSVRQTPSPVLSYVENAPQDAHISHIPVADPKQGQSKSRSVVSRVLEDVHISAQLMEDFLELARDNTEKDLETCGVLGAFLERGTIYVTTLIIPKQESTSSTCQAINEEEIFAIQNEQSLFPVGWIHMKGCEVELLTFSWQRIGEDRRHILLKVVSCHQ